MRTDDTCNGGAAAYASARQLDQVHKGSLLSSVYTYFLRHLSGVHPAVNRYQYGRPIAAYINFCPV